MKILNVCVLALAVTALPAAEKRAERKPSPRSAKSKRAPVTPAPELTLPPDAVEIDPNTYSQTDKQGKKWIYRKTPFGLAKIEDNSAPSGALEKAKAAEDEERITAVENGDSIRFERASPFGQYRWSRRKTELNETEQAIWNREREKHTSAGKARQE